MLFDETNPNWTAMVEHNLLYLKGCENYINQVLDARGHVLLNDVYDLLKIARSKEGATSGWAHVVESVSEDEPEKDLPYIDFGICYGCGHDSPNIELTFNYESDILDKIWPE